MKQELKQHLIPLLAIFLLTCLVWILLQLPIFSFVYLFFGLAWGAFFLDLDHLIFWFYLKPDLPQSQQAQKAVQEKDIKKLLNLLDKHHKSHTSLIFHHFFFQVVLAFVSLFVFTSSSSIFAKAFLLAINVHLLVDEIYDFRFSPRRLQNWLFAREEKQLPQRYLPHYLGFFIFLNLVSWFLLINSQL